MTGLEGEGGSIRRGAGERALERKSVEVEEWSGLGMWMVEVGVELRAKRTKHTAGQRDVQVLITF